MLKVEQVLKEEQEHKVLKVYKAPKVQQVLKEEQEHKVLKVQQVLKEI